jgi:AcrR family transcriptional regulator
VSTSESAYHHGSLRDALIAAGMAALEGASGLDLSLRKLARTVGVSPAAVYRHFPNKQALLAALSREGLEMLGAAQRAAYDRAGGGSQGFVETGRAYVRFALEHPALFRLVFAHGEPIADKSDPASQLLHDSTVDLTGSDGPEAQRLALQAWSLGHGIAMLMLDKRLPADDTLIERLIDACSFLPTAQGSSSDESP